MKRFLNARDSSKFSRSQKTAKRCGGENFSSSFLPINRPLRLRSIRQQTNRRILVQSNQAHLIESPPLSSNAHLHFSPQIKNFYTTLSDMLSHLEVEKHNKSDDLWVIVDGNAYDLTDVSSLNFSACRWIARRLTRFVDVVRTRTSWYAYPFRFSYRSRNFAGQFRCLLRKLNLD